MSQDKYSYPRIDNQRGTCPVGECHEISLKKELNMTYSNDGPLIPVDKDG